MGAIFSELVSSALGLVTDWVTIHKTIIGYFAFIADTDIESGTDSEAEMADKT